MSYSADFLNICCDVLYEGNDLLGTDLGVVARVEGGVYEVVAVVPPNGLFRPGDTYLLEATFSMDVCERREIVVLSEFGGEPGLQKHTLYRALGAEFFVGVPILIGSELWGTVSFSSRSVRAEAVDAADLRILAAGAAELAAAEPLACPALITEIRAATETARDHDRNRGLPSRGQDPHEEEEPLPDGIILLPPRAARPRTRGASV